MQPHPSPESELDEHVNESVDAVLERLRSLGGRVTTARRLLLRSLFSDPSHRTAEELAAIVQAEVPEVHLSTVYRNLEELEELGVVAHVHLGHGPATYHLAPTTHGHLFCEQCGSVSEIDDAEFELFAESVLRAHGFTINRHHFAMLGRCESCMKADAAANAHKRRNQ